jgi:hypothetical protein
MTEQPKTENMLFGSLGILAPRTEKLYHSGGIEARRHQIAQPSEAIMSPIFPADIATAWKAHLDIGICIHSRRKNRSGRSFACVEISKARRHGRSAW